MSFVCCAGFGLCWGLVSLYLGTQSLRDSKCTCDHIPAPFSPFTGAASEDKYVSVCAHVCV